MGHGGRRRALAQEFRGRPATEGQGLILAESVERFAREQLLGLVLDRLRAQVRAAHRVLLALAAVAVLGPLIYLIAGG